MATYPFLTSFVSHTVKPGLSHSQTTCRCGPAALAPELRYCTRVVGGAFMIIMGLIDGTDVFYEFKRSDLPPTVLEDIHNALKKLHEAGLVFGDMRRPNVMLVKSRDAFDEDEGALVEGEWHVQPVDINWSGPVSKAKYPPTLNSDGRIMWVSGIEPYRYF